MRFDNPHAFVHEALTSQTHVHQRLVQLLRNVAVRSSHQPCDFLEVSPEQRVSRPRVARNDDRVLISASFQTVQKLQLSQLRDALHLGRLV